MVFKTGRSHFHSIMGSNLHPTGGFDNFIWVKISQLGWDPFRMIVLEGLWSLSEADI